MKSLFLSVCFLWVSTLQVRGQCTVSKDRHDQLITTCQLTDAPVNNAPLREQITLLGSEFMGFPVWQPGRIRLDSTGQELACLLAYNVVSQQVLCRFEGDETETRVTPYAFVLNGVEYSRQLKSVLGLNYTLYTTPLTGGPTKLLKSVKSRLVRTPIRNAYDRDQPFAGYYQVEPQYYIQKGAALPQPINLTKNALLAVLADQQERLESSLPKRKLTVDQVIEAVNTYDSLRVVARLNSTSLTTDPDFKELLAQVKYPSQAWQAQVYARVYVGFEITPGGQLANVQLLSPQNVGYGFGQAIEKGLGKRFTTKPQYQGRYAVPVSFIYTSGMNKRLRSVPVSRLSPDLLQGLNLLEEVEVTQVMGKEMAANREVWGYYK